MRKFTCLLLLYFIFFKKKIYTTFHFYLDASQGRRLLSIVSGKLEISGSFLLPASSYGIFFPEFLYFVLVVRLMGILLPLLAYIWLRLKLKTKVLCSVKEKWTLLYWGNKTEIFPFLGQSHKISYISTLF